MGRLLPTAFFRRPAHVVAPDLLGRLLVARLGPSRVALPITEVEAYHGRGDRACHGSRGPSARNRAMFGPARHWYVFFVYGMHWMLNVVTDEPGCPSAVLLRGAGDVKGPARLARRLGVTGALDALPATRATGLWIEEGVPAPTRHRTARVGVAYAGPFWSARRWRFLSEAPRPSRPRGARAR